MPKFNWSMFAHLAQLLAPVIVTTVDPKLAPLGTAIGSGIAEAEALPGASGPEKLQHVLNIVDQTSTGINTAAGKQVVDPTVLHGAAISAINTTVEVVNLVQQKVPPTPVLHQ